MAVVAIIVIVSGVLVFLSFQGAHETRDERDSKFSSFKKVCSQDPFPNQENIDRMGDNVGTVSNWYGVLLDNLGENLVFQKVENASLFGSRREQVISGLRAAAPVGLAGAKVVSDDFMFGFDAYREGKTAKLDEVPRLMYQLELIDAIVREMYAAKVLSISRVERETFDVSSGDAAQEEEEEPSSRRRGRRGRRSSSDDDSSSSSMGGSSSSNAEGDLADFPLPLNRQRFHFEFLAKEESLVDLLNRLSSMDRYVAVTALEFVKTGSDFFAPKEEEKSGKSGKSGKSSFGKKKGEPEPVVAPQEPTSRLARIFTGSKIESPVAVKMDVEVYATRIAREEVASEEEDVSSAAENSEEEAAVDAADTPAETETADAASAEEPTEAPAASAEEGEE